MPAERVRELERYVQSVLHVPLRLRPWRAGTAVPYFLQSRYEFFEGQLLGRQVLFLFGDDVAAGMALKHGRAIGDYWPHPVVFVFRRMRPDLRQRFVQAGIPFVVPRQQLYLPMVGVSMGERFTAPALTADTLSPSAQVALLFTLLHIQPAADTATKLARETGYTSMAMVRALNQLESAGLIRTSRSGREKLFQLATERRQTWRDAQSVLTSPVKRRVRYAELPDYPPDAGVIAGLSALAEYSALAPTGVRTLAMSLEEFRKNDALEIGATDNPAIEADLEIEIWTYDPRVLAKGDVVDPLSLYLELRQDVDERVQAALEETMEKVSW
jgi:DNA-binding MarR family transcriptional regulator